MPKESKDSEEKSPRFIWGVCIALGMVVGVAIGMAMENIGVGVAIGAGLGVAFAMIYDEAKG